MYLNWCVVVASSKDVGAPGETVPLSLEHILLDMEGGRYVGALLLSTLAELVSGRRGGVGGSSGGGGNSNINSESLIIGVGSGGSGGDGGSGSEGKSGGAGWRGASEGTGVARGALRVRVRYEEHLPILSLRDRENSHIILAGTVLPTVQGHVFFNKWYLCGL